MKKTLTFIYLHYLFHCLTGNNLFCSNSGNNSWNGSQSAPWETLQYAAGQVQAGDSVILSAGNYAGFSMGWNDEEEGTPGNPIVFKAQVGATIVSDNIHTKDGINLESVSYIIIDGFTITNEGGSITRAGNTLGRQYRHRDT